MALPYPSPDDVFRMNGRFAPNADINCRDCDVRSLAGPEPDRQVFAKFKHLLRKAAAHPAETICVTIGEILRAFTPTECATGYHLSDVACRTDDVKILSVIPLARIPDHFSSMA